jgi:hypothetical protein
LQGKGFVVEAQTKSERAQEIDKWYGDAWYLTLAKLNARLEYLDPDYTIVQIKEKFGELRFYFRTSDPSKRDEMDRAARSAERAAHEAEQRKKFFDQHAVKPGHPLNAPEW